MRINQISIGLVALLAFVSAGCRSNKELTLLRPGEVKVWDRVDKKQMAQARENLKKVQVTTNFGTFTIELYEEAAPVSVKNFLNYVNKGHYDGTIFHRVIPGFMVQGGGFLPDMSEKETDAPIINEAGNGLRNSRGTVAMARTSDLNSATAQFYINLVDNNFLNGDGVKDGYAVFGRVYNGMEVVDRIALLDTENTGVHPNVPVQPVIIESVREVQ